MDEIAHALSPVLATGASFVVVSVATRGRRTSVGAWVALPAFVVAAMIVVGYLMSAGVADHVEAAVAAVGGAWRHGQPMYHELTAPRGYSLLYGPWVFAQASAFAAAVDDPLLGGKLCGLFFTGAAGALCHASIRRSVSGPARRLLSAGLVLVVLTHGSFVLSARADATLLFCVALALFVQARVGGRRAAVAVALIAGFACNLKLHGALYLLPVIGPQLRIALTGDRRRLVGMALALAASLALPFVVLPGVDVSAYAHLLRCATGHRFSLEHGLSALSWWLVMVLPVGWLALSRTRAAPDSRVQWRALWRSLQGDPTVSFGWFLVGSLVVWVVSSKIGAGRNHVLPFLPYVIFWLARRPGPLCLPMTADGGRSGAVDERPAVGSASRRVGAVERGHGRVVVSRFALALGLALAGVGIGEWAGAYGHLARTGGRDARREVAEAMAVHGGDRMAMAPAEPYDRSVFHALLTHAGAPLLFETAAVMDLREGGVILGEDARETLARCEVPVWLVPRGGRPFLVPDYYSGAANVYPPAFEAAFRARYRRVREGRYFDTYECRPPHRGRARPR